jgi:hypothetical protein
MNTHNEDEQKEHDMTLGTFELIKADLLEQLRQELSGWNVESKLLREAFMAAVAELVDDNFGGKQAAGWPRDERTTIAPAAARDIPVIVADAFAHLARLADDLPGWCDQTDPLARGLQAGFGIGLALELIVEEDERAAMALRLVDDECFEDNERRFRYRPRLVITQDDIAARRLVATRANTVLTLADIRKER